MQNSVSKQLFRKLTRRSAIVHKKLTPPLIFYWKLSKSFLGSYFFNTKIDRCFRKRTLLLEKMLWYDKSIRPFKMCVTQERGEGRSTKKVTKNDVGGGFPCKKCDATHSKKTRFCEWRSFWCWRVWLYFLWVYLLMMLLAF